jgi:Transposase DDE domain
MLFLQSHHIADLYVWVDDALPKQQHSKTGRPLSVSDSEVVTMLVWNTIVLKQSTLKDIFDAVSLYHTKDFPKLPKYSSFVSHCHRVLPQFIDLLEQSLQISDVGIVDSSMIEVCKLHRADSHKVARNKAQFGKNWQGWHYGFKLHATMTLDGFLSSIHFTGANEYDAQVLPHLVNGQKILVGDTLYGASVMRQHIWETYGTVIIAPPFPKQNKKVATPWQTKLLSMRSKIESVFDYLKNYLHLVSSFPRSMNGYLVHYLRVLVSYQIMALSQRG